MLVVPITLFAMSGGWWPNAKQRDIYKMSQNGRILEKILRKTMFSRKQIKRAILK